jgi:hypothetical protein
MPSLASDWDSLRNRRAVTSSREKYSEKTGMK